MTVSWCIQVLIADSGAQRSTTAHVIQVRCGQFIAVVDTAALAVVVAVAIAVAGAADVAVDAADVWYGCNDSLTGF